MGLCPQRYCFSATTSLTKRRVRNRTRAGVLYKQNAMLTVTRIGEYDAWQSLAPEWSALIDRCPSATPFQRPEWLLPWWRQFGSGELAVLAIHASQRLIGLLPAFIHAWRGRRQVTLIGTGLTDYLDLTAEPEFAGACAEAALAWLSDHRDCWDICDWQDLSETSPLIISGLEREPYLPGALAALPADPFAYEASLPHGLRRAIRVASRRLERQAALEFTTEYSDDEARALQSLFRLHEERWARQGGPQSMLDAKPAQEFLIDATKALSARGMLRLYTMRFRGDIAAVIYGIFDRKRLYGYISGMDPELARFSPGSLVLRHAICDAIAEGARAWDFLRGQEEYKFHWGAQKVPKYRVRFGPAELSQMRVRRRESALA
jgi:CelD/BcsL family acetyltransferase involved in cellulose biosynthesis